LGSLEPPQLDLGDRRVAQRVEDAQVVVRPRARLAADGAEGAEGVAVGQRQRIPA
jgi:hypothetical protein